MIFIMIKMPLNNNQKQESAEFKDIAEIVAEAMD